MDQLVIGALQERRINCREWLQAFGRQRGSESHGVLFCNADGSQVAAAHAGWRGLLGTEGRGILEATVERFGKDQALLAWLGPCIGPRQFEFPPNMPVSDSAGRYETRYSWPPALKIYGWSA